jgi:hypothetical protein
MTTILESSIANLPVGYESVYLLKNDISTVYDSVVFV